MKKVLSILMCLLLATGIVFAADDLINRKFARTKSITVEVYDRSNAGGSKPEDNFFTDNIKAGMLRDHNVAVTFHCVPRWTEVEVLNNLLAANDAPDICLTYSYPTIQTYGDMGGVLDMAPYLEKYKSQLPNLFELLGDTNIYNNRNPQNGTIWAIESMFFQNNRISCFVREDWLKALNLKEPKSLPEFEAMLRAFKSEASKLLGANAEKMVPFSTSVDIGWRGDLLSASFVPDKITDKELWILGFDDRHMLWPNIKSGIRVLNKWYGEGLIWKDFPMYPYGDKTEDNMIKAGYVGSFIANWDWPYRDADNGLQGTMKKIVGPEAAYIAIDCFKNDAGVYRKYLASTTSDRKIFFPASNTEPVASLLYLDWISKFENRKFLQIGEPGVNHEVQADGSVKAIAATGAKIMNSDKNIDYTMTINGLDLGDPSITAKSLANGYPGIDKKYIERSYASQRLDARVTKNFNVGKIESESGVGPMLTEKRNTMLVQAVVASPANFDRIFDNGMKDYLKNGGQAIIDERRAKYEAVIEKKK